MSPLGNTPKMIDPQSYGFIITKPLQLLVVLSIIEQLPDEVNKELIILDSFSAAKQIADRLTTSNTKWRRAVFFKEFSAGYRYCATQQYDKVFLDTDVGFRQNITLIGMRLKSPRVRIAVFEEGIGSYRSNLYQGIKKTILSLLGVGVNFGGNWLTKEIYLFCPDEYKKKFPTTKVDLIRINTSISALLEKYESIFDDLFNLTELKTKLQDAYSKEVCDIYLTSWHWDQAAINRLKHYSSYKIVKFHPHIKHPTKSVMDNFDLSTSPSVPAEILITIASRLFVKVRVLHHGSSVVRYLARNNVEFILIDSNRT